MKAIELKKGSKIYWVGAKDWNVRDFHGYKTHRGTTYNAYLICDEKNVLIDTVKETHFDEMIERIKSVIDPSKIDYIVSNHVELDHSGSLDKMLELAPHAVVITSPNGEKGLKEHFHTEKWNFKSVKTQETLSLGKNTLQFIHIPLVHWPDSMMTYIPEEKLLLPNDACGQHLACDSIFDDEVPKETIFEEAAKYYANIVYPYSGPVDKTLKLLSGLQIEMVAPSHGVIWRKYITEIVSKYKFWMENNHVPKALIVYDSMWGTTEKMAHTIKFAFEDQGIPVVVRSLKHTHISDVLTDLLESKYVAIGSPTLNNQVLPTVAGFLTYLRGLRPQRKTALVFGSHGWNSKCLTDIEETMKELRWEIPSGTINSRYRMNDQVKNDLVLAVNRMIQEQKGGE